MWLYSSDGAEYCRDVAMLKVKIACCLIPCLNLRYTSDYDESFGTGDVDKNYGGKNTNNVDLKTRTSQRETDAKLFWFVTCYSNINAYYSVHPHSLCHAHTHAHTRRSHSAHLQCCSLSSRIDCWTGFGAKAMFLFLHTTRIILFVVVFKSQALCLLCESLSHYQEQACAHTPTRTGSARTAAPEVQYPSAQATNLWRAAVWRAHERDYMWEAFRSSPKTPLTTLLHDQREELSHIKSQDVVCMKGNNHHSQFFFNVLHYLCENSQNWGPGSWNHSKHYTVLNRLDPTMEVNCKIKCFYPLARSAGQRRENSKLFKWTILDSSASLPGSKANEILAINLHL